MSNKYLTYLVLQINPRAYNFGSRVVPKIVPLVLKHSLRLVVYKVKTLKMREIVHLQAGQCGNQIGSKASKQNLFYLYKISIAN